MFSEVRVFLTIFSKIILVGFKLTLKIIRLLTLNHCKPLTIRQSEPIVISANIHVPSLTPTSYVLNRAMLKLKVQVVSDKVVSRFWNFKWGERKCGSGQYNRVCRMSTHTNLLGNRNDICGDLPEGVITTRDTHSLGCLDLSHNKHMIIG